jgi:peptidyl-tRNA hydrolase, PTH1 family
MEWLDKILGTRSGQGHENPSGNLKILVGLGNAEPKYDLTRHNIGFRLVDFIGTGCNASFKVMKNLQCEVAKGTLENQQILLVKPHTYMNASGKAFVAVHQWYKQPLSNFLVLHDDTSLPLGRIRVQKNGGAGGQHGVESIIESLGGRNQFDRLKFGVGPDPGGDRRADYVLKKFPDEQSELVSSCLELAVRAVKTWLTSGTEAAMNSFNGVDLANPSVQTKPTNGSK